VTGARSAFGRTLAERLEARTAARVEPPDARRAAVAVIVSDEDAPALLFVKRRERDGDPWSGHVAFPGGLQSGPDETAPETAMRETEEETGLPLRSAARLLGTLDDVHPLSIYLPRVVVTPCVFTVPGRPEVHASDEIERCAWLTVSEVFSPPNRRPLSLELPTGKREFEAIHAGGLVIWGLTERILAQLGAILL
jgi:8-oxo-dGTP pyrophosphatase MutT (NUDIX family)